MLMLAVFAHIDRPLLPNACNGSKRRKTAILLHRIAILLHAQPRYYYTNPPYYYTGGQMPYKSERCIIAGTKYDKRRKLTEEQKAEITELIGLSSREIARMYGVSRRTVQFIQHPERLQRNKQCRANRGGWRQYYDRQGMIRHVERVIFQRFAHS